MCTAQVDPGTCRVVDYIEKPQGEGAKEPLRLSPDDVARLADARTCTGGNAGRAAQGCPADEVWRVSTLLRQSCSIWCVVCCAALWIGF